MSRIREEEASFDRVLATVLFTDIVGSTERATELGDRRWRELVAGSGLLFENRCAHEPEGVPGKWRLYAVGHE